MVFASAFLSFVLLATGAAAVPASSERRAARLARRSAPRKAADSSFAATATNETQVSYSSNWSGAVLSSSTGTYKSVTATFTVPTPKRSSSGGSGTQSSSAWVGIDGDTCETSILQTGLDFSVSSSGAVSYDAWYEWYPDYAYDFTGISFSAGDSVTVTVTASSTKAGTAVIKNNTKGTSVTKSITSTAALCEKDAEWIVEDYEEGSSLVPLANFGTVTFTGASAGTASGSVGPSGAEIIDLEQNNKVLTSVTTSSNSVTVKYTGS